MMMSKHKTITFASLKKHKRELTFLMIGTLMLGIVVMSAAYSIHFLTSNLNLALDAKIVPPVAPLQFEFYKVKELEK